MRGAARGAPGWEEAGCQVEEDSIPASPLGIGGDFLCEGDEDGQPPAPKRIPACPLRRVPADSSLYAPLSTSS